ncbi:MAG: hypothetical protein QW328_06930 [Nitrososphaerota archaeon]
MELLDWQFIPTFSEAIIAVFQAIELAPLISAFLEAIIEVKPLFSIPDSLEASIEL